MPIVLDTCKRVDLTQIKLIIWDLDEAFWIGTLSEQSVVLPEKHLQLINMLTDKGILNSICSKNDSDLCREKLSESGIWHYFVFPSINWQPKGERIKNIIAEMQLSQSNVLFIDDNISNLGEAKYYCPALQVARPEVIDCLYEQALQLSDSDRSHKRLQQYKLLEEKQAEKKVSASNEEFLRNSRIQIIIQRKCTDEIDRIHEMIMRTNQLNFTKRRISKEELASLITDEDVIKGYVSVSDKFGDYGIVGFFAQRGKKLEHFLFSCRALGMGVEQYVYGVLDFPELEVCGEVATELHKGVFPDWVNSVDKIDQNDDGQFQSDFHILFKGPCDIEQVFTFIKCSSNIDREFTYHSETIGVAVQYNHSITIINSANNKLEPINDIFSTSIFVDKDLYNTKIFTKKYDIIFYSILPDAGLAIYKRKNKDDQLLVFGDYPFSFCDPNNWEGFLSGKYYTNEITLTREILEKFACEFDYLGLITDEQFYRNICEIRQRINPDTLLVFLNGAEIPFTANKKPAYVNRHLVHQRFNRILARVCREYANTTIIDVNKHITGQHCYTDCINHFTKTVYYKIAQDMIEIINNNRQIVTLRSKNYIIIRSMIIEFLYSIIQIVRRRRKPKLL